MLWLDSASFLRESTATMYYGQGGVREQQTKLRILQNKQKMRRLFKTFGIM